MSLQVTFTVTDPKKAASIIASLTGQAGAAAPAPKKAKKVVEDEDEEETQETASDDGAEDEEEVEAADADEETEESSDDEDGDSLTLEDDIIPAFKAFTKKNGREKAAKILKSFGVASVRDLKESKYKAVLAKLGAKG